MSDINTLVESLADLIAEKVAAKLQGQSSETIKVPEATRVPATKDKTSKPATAKAAKPAPEPAPEPEDVVPAPEEPVSDTDLVTDEQQAFVAETVAAADIDEIKSQLLDYFVSQGNPKDEISSTLVQMDEAELRAAYADYTCRLVIEKDDGEMEFTPSFEDPYKASRISEGEQKLHWVKGGVTLSDEDVKAAKLPDPNKKAPVAPPAKRTALPGKKK